jgi:hypothetical protein
MVTQLFGFALDPAGVRLPGPASSGAPSQTAGVDLEASIAWYQRVLFAQHLSKFDHVDSSGTSYAANSGSA